MLFYRAALPLSRATLSYVAGVIRRHRRQIGSCWRKLNPGRQALLVLAYLRKGETFADLAAGFGVSTATAWRYAAETVRLLAARAPKLRSALRAATKAGHAFVVIDGTLIPVNRLAADRPFFSGKHKKHGMNLQVIASPDGEILWVSGPLPGAVHDLTAARIWGLVRELAAAGLIVLADKGYIGAGQQVRTPYRGRGKPESQKAANRAHAQLRAPGERANAQLKTWRHPAQTPLLPLARRATRQSHPCPSDPRDHRMKKAHCLGGTPAASQQMAGRGLRSGVAAETMARRRLVWPGACRHWLPVWLPHLVSAANIRRLGGPIERGGPPDRARTPWSKPSRRPHTHTPTALKRSLRSPPTCSQRVRAHQSADRLDHCNAPHQDAWSKPPAHG